MMDSSLEMFIDDDVVEFTPGHLGALHASWGKMDRSNKLFVFNHQYHKQLLAKRNNASLLYVAGLGIPFYSDFAREVAIERGIIK